MSLCQLVKDTVQSLGESEDQETQAYLRRILLDYDLPATLRLCLRYKDRPEYLRELAERALAIDPMNEEAKAYIQDPQSVYLRMS